MCFSFLPSNLTMPSSGVGSHSYVKHGGLAGAIGPQKAEQPRLRYDRYHFIENLESTQRDADVFNGKQWMR